MGSLALDARRSLRLAAVVMVVAYGAGAALRYGLIEREDLGLLCESAPLPAWCAARLFVIRAFLHDAFAIASLVSLCVAVWRRAVPFALSAIALGTVGMVLYGFTWSGVGVLGGLLVSGRLQADRDQHGEREAER
jgi:hypothetical protein